MSKLTLDDAIKHCLEVAEDNEQFASGKWIGSEGEANRQECEQCAADHRQLAEWLTELKDLRAEQNDQYTFIRELMDELNDAKRLLKAAIGIIKDVDCNEDYLCDECEYRAKCDGGFSFYWRYANEAENLLNDEK